MELITSSQVPDFEDEVIIEEESEKKLRKTYRKPRSPRQMEPLGGCAPDDTIRESQRIQYVMNSMNYHPEKWNAKHATPACQTGRI